jgi:hypothetical protein
VGATAIGTAAAFLVDAASTADGVNGSVAGTVGTAATTTPPVYTVSSVAHAGYGIDYLDFSAYNAKAVYVDGVLVKGTAPTAVGQTYITLVESATNDGSYTMTQYQEAGALGTAGDTVVGVIGVADFGVEKDFLAQNFIL